MALFMGYSIWALVYFRKHSKIIVLSLSGDQAYLLLIILWGAYSHWAIKFHVYSIKKHAVVGITCELSHILGHYNL